MIIQQKLTRLLLSFCHAVFPIMKSFVLLQKKDPQIHWFHVEQLRFVKTKENLKSGKKFMKLDVTL